MGKRGPKPGFKKAREAAAAASAPSAPAAKKTRVAAKKVAAPAPAPAPAAEQVPPPINAPLPKEPEPAAEAPVLSAADRENPNKLSGQALRDHAHRRGMAKSILATMPDEKIRTELRYITQRQYTEDGLA